MSKLKKFTVHLHATFTPTAELDGGKIAVVMGDPEVTECDCKPAPGVFAHPGGLVPREPRSISQRNPVKEEK